MKYLLLNWADEEAWAALGEAEQKRLKAATRPYVEELAAAGQFLGGARLHPATTATVVEMRAGKRSVTDGPFIETREQIAGYALIEAADLDEAIEISGNLLKTLAVGRIEIRPVLLVNAVMSCTGAPANETRTTELFLGESIETDGGDRELSA